MVKEGSFLNSDADYPTTRSRLVHIKQSMSIVDDVRSGPAISEFTEEKKTESIIRVADQRTKPSKKEGWVNGVDKEMLGFKMESVPTVVAQSPQSLEEGPLPTIWNREDDHEITDVPLAIQNGETNCEMIEASEEATCLSEDDYVSDQEQHVDKEKMVGFVGIFSDTSMNGSACPNLEGSIFRTGVPASSNLDLIPANAVPHRDLEEKPENEASMLVLHEEDEAFRERLKLILRSH